MTTKFDNFKAALIALCDEHYVMLAPSAYDDMQVWDRQEWAKGGHEAIYDDCLIDCTGCIEIEFTNPTPIDSIFLLDIVNGGVTEVTEQKSPSAPPQS